MYVLIIISTLAGGAHSRNMAVAEFSSEERCKAAREAVVDEFEAIGFEGVKGFCFKQ